MSNDTDKKRWKKEAKQLKEDLKNRKKVVQTREVPITFPKKTNHLNKIRHHQTQKKQTIIYGNTSAYKSYVPPNIIP